jgi:hypothetical protein
MRILPVTPICRRVTDNPVVKEWREIASRICMINERPVVELCFAEGEVEVHAYCEANN